MIGRPVAILVAIVFLCTVSLAITSATDSQDNNDEETHKELDKTIDESVNTLQQETESASGSIASAGDFTSGPVVVVPGEDPTAQLDEVINNTQVTAP